MTQHVEILCKQSCSIITEVGTSLIWNGEEAWYQATGTKGFGYMLLEFLYVYVCVVVCISKKRCQLTESEVPGSCELPDVGAGS